MITKGIVEDILDEYMVKVRMPFIDSIKDAKQSTPTSLLNDAIICSLPNSNPNLNINDIVIIGFENNDLSKPIILGHLYRETASESYIDLITRQFTVNSICKLPYQTTIGEVTPDQIKTLTGIKTNIQEQIDALEQKIINLTNSN